MNSRESAGSSGNLRESAVKMRYSKKNGMRTRVHLRVICGEFGGRSGNLRESAVFLFGLLARKCGQPIPHFLANCCTCSKYSEPPVLARELPNLLFLFLFLDILARQETKLGQKHRDSELRIDGYTLFRRDRNPDGGGVALYIRD